jgi:MFS family permease
MTAPVGWLASRFGRKNVALVSLAGFTITSMMCGAAQTLDQMVVFRLLQGVFGAALSPLSQSIMLDLYPPQKRGGDGDLGHGRDARPDSRTDAWAAGSPNPTIGAGCSM